MKFSYLSMCAVMLLLIHNGLTAQAVKFKKGDLTILEPFNKKDKANLEIEHIIKLNIEMEDLTPTSVLQVQIDPASTYPTAKAVLVNSTVTTESGELKIKVSTDEWSSDDKYILISVFCQVNGIMKMFSDTLFVKNSYPTVLETQQSPTDWQDGKRAEIFIGTNFDFLDSKVKLSDWYGGARVFLPAITDLKFKTGKQKTRVPRIGLNAGIYHAKSLSNFGNPTADTTSTQVYGRVTGYFGDSATVRFDTVKTKSTTEISNWGLYLAPMYHMSHYESPDGKFITNIHIAAHVEVIRRNVAVSYQFDTLNSSFKNFRTVLVHRNYVQAPSAKINTYYDAYFGVSIPFQFLWKDILDMKINPSIGFGSRGFSPYAMENKLTNYKSSVGYYFVQFDLLARLGGLRLNLGGEVRGYFPKENPIITAYLGTSFSIQKLVDFVSSQ